MSISTLNKSSIIDDFDDFDDIGDRDYVSTELSAAPQRPGDVLARLLLAAVLSSKKFHKMLSSPSRLIIMRAKDDTTAQLLDSYLSEYDPCLTVQAYTEMSRSGGRFEPKGRDELRKLEYGRSVVLISQDPERILIPEALVNADAIIDVPAPNLAAVRKTISCVTGKRVRGLRQSDIEGLRTYDLIAAIRPGLSPGRCVANLRRASSKLSNCANDMVNVPALEELAMTKLVSDWALGTMKLMRKVPNYEIDPSALRYACFEGLPGTGKTTVAASLAKSGNWGFVSTSVGEWFAGSGGHLGDVIRAAQRFFDEIALAKGPVIGLLDEIDALPNRAVMEPKDAQFWTPVVTFVLTEIDRLRQSGKPILVIGATNHFDRLDSALVRPGRLEAKVSFSLPTLDDRCRLFQGYVGRMLSADAIRTLARLAIGASPAQINSWCLTAIATAETHNRDLSLRDLVDLVAPPTARSAEMDRTVAIHEAGHAIVAHDLGLPIEEISILSIGDVGGFVNIGHQERNIFTRSEIEHLGTMLLGGRAADIVLGRGANAGAASDLEAVNHLLRSAMLDLGLYGSLKTARNVDSRNFRDGVTLATTIETELNRLLERAVEVVARRQRDICRLVEVLLTERVIPGERFVEIIEGDSSERSVFALQHSGPIGRLA